eukprot:SAG31_NODE_2445_length_5681_cov_18.644930_3_plen_41_part_00
MEGYSPNGDRFRPNTDLQVYSKIATSPLFLLEFRETLYPM